MLSTPTICQVMDVNRKYVRQVKADLFDIKVLEAETKSTLFSFVLRRGMLNFTSMKEATTIGIAYSRIAILQFPIKPIIGDPNTVIIGGIAKSFDIALARISWGMSSPTRATDIG